MKTMNLKAILLAVSLIGAAVTAQAAPTVSGDTNPAANNENYTFEHLTLPAGAFNDWISFSIDGYRDLSAAISATSTSGISFSAFNLYAADQTTLLVTGLVGNPFPTLAFGGLTASAIAPTSYWINIVGTNTASSNYNGSIALTAAVPEPSTYGMLALGLGLVGFAARSRSKFSA